MSPQGSHFSPHSTAKTNDKSTNLKKNGIYWYKSCCDRFSVLRENCVILQIKKARCTLNKEILDLLNEESVSGAPVVELVYKFEKSTASV